MPRPPHPLARLCALSSLVALSASLLACGAARREGGGGYSSRPARVVQLVVALDLGAEQGEGEEWARRVVRRASQPLAALGVQLELSRFVSIDSSDGARPLPLDALRARLEALRAAGGERRGERRGEGAEELWVAVTSFPPASFPRLSDLSLARQGDPALVLRRLSGLGGLAEAAERGEARLLTRAVAAALGALEGCERDTMTLTRDELLGWRATRGAAARGALERSPPQGGTSASSQARRAERGPPSSPAPRLPPLTFSERNAALVSAADPCARLPLLDRSCAAQQAPARLYTHACYISAEDWAGALRRGELGVESWEEERLIARGAEAALRGDHAEALARCAPVADHSPSGFAAWCAGSAAAALGDLEAAARYLRALLAARPNHAPALLLLAKTLGRGGDHLSAAALLASALATAALSPAQRAEALYNLGVARAKEGDWAAAAEAWRALPPESEEARRAAPLLEEARGR